MPRLARWAVRLALLYLAAGATLGAASLLQKARGEPLDPRWTALHAELLLLGWVAQFVFGVAFWILPRFLATRPRGHTAPAAAALACLNAGLLLAALDAARPAPALALAARTLELVAALAFALHAWPRVLRAGRIPRPPQS